MNEQLQQTIQALQGGVTNVDANSAISNVSSWQNTLGGAQGADTLVGQRARRRSGGPAPAG